MLPRTMRSVDERHEAADIKQAIFSADIPEGEQVLTVTATTP
jgi:hypothetical protein